MQSKKLLQFKSCKKRCRANSSYLTVKTEDENSCVRRSENVKLKSDMLLEILRLTKSIAAVGEIAFRLPGPSTR
jgi:hypothetical protein